MYRDISVSNEDVFIAKLVNIKEIKLKEFNFKVLHNILPCNANLAKWGKIDHDTCDICNELQTIKHLLFDCNYVKPLWKIIESILHCNITYSNILCGFNNNNSQFCNYLSSISAFVIYKEWLLLSLVGKGRQPVCNIALFEQEISFRLDIYDKARLKYS